MTTEHKPQQDRQESGVSKRPDFKVSRKNSYERTVIEIHAFYGGGKVVRQHETTIVTPPCTVGPGCRACDYGQAECGYDPTTGYCNGRMP